MTLQELKLFCQPVRILGSDKDPVGKLTDHSGDVSAGDVFIAVKGAQHDGHQYISSAIEKGASLIISESFEGYEPVNCAVFVVHNTRLLLPRLSLAWYKNPQNRLHLVGVTGTNGKTTVSTLIWDVLRKLGVSAALLGTVEKRFGDAVEASTLTTPGALELARDLERAVQAGCTHCVMEVSSHALDQGRVDGLNFDVAVFTNLSHDHLDYHVTLEAYAAAKQKLFTLLKPGATAIVNRDDPFGMYMAEKATASVWDVSFSDDSALTIVENSMNGLILDLDGTSIQSPLTGRFNAYNVAVAWLACVALGFSEPNTAAALSTAVGAPGRLERVPSGNDQPVVLVDYAHTPDALENVLKTLADLKKADESITVVFGCGGDRDRTKRPFMAAIAEKFADSIWVTSDNPRTEDPHAIISDIMNGFTRPEKVNREENRAEAIRGAVGQAHAKTIVLIAGKGHETYQEIGRIRHHFDDREEAMKALSVTKRVSGRKAATEHPNPTGG